jgi:hypothetical protein
MSGWQPIATAPKDGTEILIAGGRVHLGSDDMDDGKGHKHKGVSLALWNERAGGYWYQPGTETTSHGGNSFEPTHWMPLPQPPGK